MATGKCGDYGTHKCVNQIVVVAKIEKRDLDRVDGSGVVFGYLY